MKMTIRTVLLITFLLKGFLGSLNGQTIDDLDSFLIHCKGFNLGEERIQEIYNNLKEDPDSVKVLYNLLNSKIDCNAIFEKPLIMKTEFSNFYDVYGFGADFDPESIPNEGKKALVIYSAIWCLPCHKLTDTIKSIIKSEKFTTDIFHVDLYVDPQRKGHEPWDRYSTNPHFIDKYIRQVPNVIPIVYFIDDKRRIIKIMTGYRGETIKAVTDFLIE